jgi:hypothetical protein
LKEQYPKKAVGRPRIKYLKQVARNAGADSYTAMKKNGLQQFQVESCQLIKRLKDDYDDDDNNNNNNNKCIK